LLTLLELYVYNLLHDVISESLATEQNDLMIVNYELETYVGEIRQRS